LGGDFLINIYDIYITPEEYAEAERNGIGRVCLSERIRKHGWGKHKAMTTPKLVRLDHSHMKKVMVSHGISSRQFHSRLSEGWDEWSAATVPMRNSAELRELCNWIRELRGRKYPHELYALAKENGISADLFCERIKVGWSRELASTLPPSHYNGAIVYKLKKLYGDYYHTYLRDRSFLLNKDIGVIINEMFVKQRSKEESPTK
jgi:hypothetical protein